MRKLALLSLLPLIMIAGELEYKGNLTFEAQYLHHDIDNKRDNVLALRLEAEVKKEVGDGVFVAKLKGILDKDDEERRYVDFNDLYYQYNFEDSDILIGRNTRFWGALEFYNLTDVFNAKDFLDDPFDYDSKLGAWNVAYTKYLENSEISLIVKLHEERQKIQDSESVNNFFPLPYHDKLITTKDENRPTVYLKYSGSGEEVQVDYGVVYQNGYDAKRYISMENGSLQQNAYIVNKLMGYATYIRGDTIYKTELAYAVSDESTVSDYVELGVGFEHTLYSFWDKKDLGLLAEYYRYEVKDEGKIDVSGFFADDLTLGFRLSMNDMSSSEVLGGIDIDLDTKEKIFFVEYDTRVFEKYKLKTSYQHLAPEDESLFKELDRVKLEFGYYF
ncbi:MAG TPA: hypothetical protein EYG95_04745 [Campylobacterales bacterium]|nr:hypothetical protein [Campylobacterales bacterium]